MIKNDNRTDFLIRQRNPVHIAR